MRWLPSAQLRADSSSLAPGRSRYANLEADFQTLSVEETSNDEGPKTFSQSQLPNGSDAAGNNN